MAASYCLLFLWMASLVALSHSEHTIQVQVFPTEYAYSPADHSDLNDFIYHDEACQSVSDSSQSIECSRKTRTPKLMDCDLGGFLSESFYSLKLNSITQHTFTFTFDNMVNFTALSLHYYCTMETQEDPPSFCVDVIIQNFSPLCIPCVANHKQKEILRFSSEIASSKLLMFINSDYSSQLYISEIQFFIEAPVIDESSDDPELRIPCLVSTSNVPSTCDHWWVDYESYDDIRKNITLGVHDRLPECGSNNTSSAHVEENGVHSCEITVTFQDDCTELMPTVSLVYDSAALPTATGSSTPTSPPSGTRDSNVAVIAGAVIGVVAGLTLCAIVSLIFVIYLLSRRRKDRIFLGEKESNSVIPLNIHNRSGDPIREDYPVLENTPHSKSAVADTKPFEGVNNPAYPPDACSHAESQTLGTTQTPSTGQGQPVLYDEVKNRDQSRIGDHTYLHIDGTECDSVDSQLNSEPAYCLATPNVIQLDPTYSHLKLQDSRAAAKEQDPTYSHLDHKTTAMVQDPTYSHLDHKTSTVKQDPTYSHIHHRLTAEEQSSALDDEYARLDCKTATKSPDPASAEYSRLKLDHETLSEKQEPTSY